MIEIDLIIILIFMILLKSDWCCLSINKLQGCINILNTFSITTPDTQQSHTPSLQRVTQQEYNPDFGFSVLVDTLHPAHVEEGFVLDLSDRGDEQVWNVGNVPLALHDIPTGLGLLDWDRYYWLAFVEGSGFGSLFDRRDDCLYSFLICNNIICKLCFLIVINFNLEIKLILIDRYQTTFVFINCCLIIFPDLQIYIFIIRLINITKQYHIELCITYLICHHNVNINSPSLQSTFVTVRVHECN